MDTNINQKLINVLNDVVEPLNKADKYSSLLQEIGDARFVLIGEATHGTHEFYQKRVEITQQLIMKKGFMAVAIEGDWPDAYEIHRYLQGIGKKEEYKQALGKFTRFPAWMWRNTVLPPFLQWLRSYNDQHVKTKVGFYGLDLYSMNSSMHEVIAYLNKIDPEAAQRARKRYSCFDHMSVDPQAYGYLTSVGTKQSCMNEAIEQLLELQHRSFEYVSQDKMIEEDEYFYATQNARVVKDAECYYRSLFEGRINSWNVRDKHMAETLNILASHLEQRFNKPSKIIVWAHNSHVGDARATEFGDKGEVNLGQLVREQYGSDSYLIGFSTYQGFVTAASDWDEPPEHKKIIPGFSSSYEELFHQVKYEQFILHLMGNKQLEPLLNISRLQRAIGVVYHPHRERLSHYFFTRLPYQFDSIIHIDKTTAVQPLDVSVEWQKSTI